jgi:hypothetical protein
VDRLGVYSRCPFVDLVADDVKRMASAALEYVERLTSSQP